MHFWHIVLWVGFWYRLYQMGFLHWLAWMCSFTDEVYASSFSNVRDIRLIICCTNISEVWYIFLCSSYFVYLTYVALQYAKFSMLHLQAVCLLNAYKELRGECQETYYNLGRAMNQLGMFIFVFLSLNSFAFCFPIIWFSYFAWTHFNITFDCFFLWFFFFLACCQHEHMFNMHETDLYMKILLSLNTLTFWCILLFWWALFCRQKL